MNRATLLLILLVGVLAVVAIIGWTRNSDTGAVANGAPGPAYNTTPNASYNAPLNSYGQPASTAGSGGYDAYGAPATQPGSYPVTSYPAQSAVYTGANDGYISDYRPILIQPRNDYRPSAAAYGNDRYEQESADRVTVAREGEGSIHHGHELAVVGGSAAGGAAIGAIAGGGRGAGIGALAGGMGGWLYTRFHHHHRRD